MNSGDTAWVLVSAALVMLMTPGLALFYGGMVRSKNVLSTVMHSMFALGLVSVLWVVVGYSLAFGPDVHHFIGNLNWAFFNGVGQTPAAALAPTIPAIAFACFQMFFAVITPALITGAFAERIKFSSFAVFTALWLLLIYCPLAHWVWAPGGWLRDLGALDFAGGTVVHINAGVAGLAAALVIGKRRGIGGKGPLPHNIPMTVLGASLLWFGWFGFNAGSALTAGGLASQAFLNTNTATAAALLGWVFVDVLTHRRGTTMGAISGAIAGLVAITPAAGFVNPMGSLAIGLAAGIICAYAVRIKHVLGYDDALDVVGVHMIGGIIGALLIGIFGTVAVNAAGANGLLFGGGLSLLGKQAIAVGATLVFAFCGSFILLKIIDKFMGLRVSPEHEETGLDIALHGEAAYTDVEPEEALPERAPALV